MILRKTAHGDAREMRRLAKLGLSSREIGQRLGIHPVTVWRRACAFGLRLPSATQMRMRNKRQTA